MQNVQICGTDPLMAGSLVGVLEGLVSPQTYSDGWKHVNDRTYQVVLREFEGGSTGPWAFVQGLSTTAGDVLGYNGLFQGGFNVDRATWNPIGGAAQRWTEALGALSQIAGTMAGGLRMYNPVIGGAKLGAGKLASSPAAALVSNEAKLCLKPRLRVLAAIEESRLARQASRFDEFEKTVASKQAINKLREIPKGSRPDPSTYLSKVYIESHLAQFDSGVVKIAATAPTRPLLGPPGGTYVLPKHVADRLIAESGGDVVRLEKYLGLDSGTLGASPVRIDIPHPTGLRMPNGNEIGANNQWLPGGFTSGGLPEATIDQVPITAIRVAPAFGK